MNHLCFSRMPRQTNSRTDSGRKDERKEGGQRVTTNPIRVAVNDLFHWEKGR